MVSKRDDHELYAAPISHFIGRAERLGRIWDQRVSLSTPMKLSSCGSPRKTLKQRVDESTSRRVDESRARCGIAPWELGQPRRDAGANAREAEVRRNGEGGERRRGIHGRAESSPSHRARYRISAWELRQPKRDARAGQHAPRYGVESHRQQGMVRKKLYSLWIHYFWFLAVYSPCHTRFACPLDVRVFEATREWLRNVRVDILLGRDKGN